MLTINKGISQDGLTVHLTDATVYGANAIPVRTSLGLVLSLKRKASAGDEAANIGAYDPTTIASFSVGVENKDGQYEGTVYALPRYTSGVLAEGDVVLNNTTLAPARFTGGVLVPITVDQIVNGEVTELAGVSFFVTTQATILRDQLELKLLEKLEASLSNKCDHNEYAVAQKNFNYVRALRSGALIDKCMNLTISAQKKIETAVSFGTEALK